MSHEQFQLIPLPNRQIKLSHCRPSDNYAEEDNAFHMLMHCEMFDSNKECLNVE